MIEIPTVWLRSMRAGLNWLRFPVPARFDGRLEQRLVAADQYDGLIVLRRVSPPAFLY